MTVRPLDGRLVVVCSPGARSGIAMFSFRDCHNSPIHLWCKPIIRCRHDTIIFLLVKSLTRRVCPRDACFHRKDAVDDASGLINKPCRMFGL